MAESSDISEEQQVKRKALKCPYGRIIPQAEILQMIGRWDFRPFGMP